MPYIFPKRRLKRDDVLDPNDLNQDFVPVQELLSGQLDAKNFIASDLKSNVTVATGAYFTPHYTKIEVPVSLGNAAGNTTTSMNFVQTDGATLRPPPAEPARPTNKNIFVIPNTQAWVSITHIDPDDDTKRLPIKIDLDTDQAVLWITAYVQYVWNGFFEPKGGPGIDAESGTYKNKGHFGLDPTEFTNSDGEQRAPYAYRLREASSEIENKYPDRGGFHHLSRGERPANVQFAIRIDGRVIEESITGKHGTYDHEPKGFRAGESSNSKAGQRSFKYKVTYDNALPRPGQRIPTEQAVGLGPEVLPVRFGCVVPVAPGNHEIEIIARRLRPMKNESTRAGDYVGVFSRRLLAMELPAYAARATSRVTPPTIPHFESETTITETRIGTNTSQKLQNRLNDIRVADVARNSLPNTHLPSKVKFSKRTAITPDIVEDDDGANYSKGKSRARWPGWAVNARNKVVTTARSGWGKNFADSNGAGWFMLDDGGSDQLLIENSNLTVGEDEFLITMADVNLRRITPMKSDFTGDLDVDEPNDWRDYLCWYMPHKYLDLYVAFSIGYYDGSAWNIVDAHRPSWINRYNWIHRGPGYRSNDSVEKKRTGVGLTGGVGLFGNQTTHGFTVEGASLDGRGGETEDGLQSTNIPLFWALEGSVAPQTIEKVAVFVTAAVPGWWRRNATREDIDFRMWQYPARDILKGLQIRWGNSHLSAIKVEK